VSGAGIGGNFICAFVTLRFVTQVVSTVITKFPKHILNTSKSSSRCYNSSSCSQFR